MVWKKRVRIIGLARCKFLSEPLEPRTMLSLSGTILSGPQTAVGNMWTYSYEGLDEIDTVGIVGTTTENGQPAVERDTSSYANGLSGGVGSVQKDYLQANSAGLVDYNQTNTNYNTTGGVQSTTSHLFEPAEVIIPATLEVGQPVTVTTVDTFTVTDFTNNDMNATVTRNISNTGTLVSDTPAPLTVPAGTFSCYQVQQTLVWTQDSGTTTINETVYLAVGVGIVEINETDTTDNGNGGGGSGSSVKVLDSFTGGDRLVFNPQQPPNVQAGDPIQPSFTVSVEDSTGDVETDATGTVTLTPAGVNGDNPITGNTAPLVDGVATFGDVVLTKAGVYQLNATDTNDDAAGISSKFGVGGDTLEFAVQPRDTDPGQALKVKVSALTAKGKPDTTLDDTVQLALNTVTGGVGATLAGNTTLAFKNGSATFTAASQLAIAAPGTYSLSATALSDGSTDYTVTGATSDNFTIAGYHLAFTKQPGTVDVFDPVPLKVSLLTSDGKVDKDESSAQVELSMDTVSGGDGAVLGGTMSATFKDGVATFPVAAAPILNGGGTFTLTATEVGSDNPAADEMSKPFVVRPFELRDHPVPGFNNVFVAIRGFQILSISGLPALYVDVYTSEGKPLTQAAIPPSELPNLQYTVTPVSPGAAVDQTEDQSNGGVYQSAPDVNGSANPDEYDTKGSALPFATPGTYRLQFDPTTSSDTADNFAAAPSAIKPYTTPLLKAVDPTILAKTSARVLAVGETLSVSASLVVEDDNERNAFPQTSTGFKFQLLGVNTSETYVQAENSYGSDASGNAALDFTIQNPGKYQLVLSVIYTPGGQGMSDVTPFSSSSYLPADGLISLTIPIVVT